MVKDIIKLGSHRVLCGNATSKKDVDKLVGNLEVDLLLTDPPYGISIVTPQSDGGANRRRQTSNLQQDKEKSESAQNRAKNSQHTHTHLMIQKSYRHEHTNPSSTMTNPSIHNTFLTSMFLQSYSEETTSLTNSLSLTSGLYGTRNHHLMVNGIISVTVN